MHLQHWKHWLGVTARESSRTASRLAARITIATARPYHPLGGHRQAKLARSGDAFNTRMQLLSDAIKRYEAQSFCDLGCAEGHYVRHAANDHGLFSVGVDGDPERLRRAAAVAILDEDWSSGFVQMDITCDSLRRLPPFDIIACMSLLHHIIHRRGLDEAHLLLSAIAEKASKCMIFDMGGPDEIENPWAGSLSMLSGDVDQRIGEMLARCGFKNIQVVGKTAGFNSTVTRSMFIAEPVKHTNSR